MNNKWNGFLDMLNCKNVLYEKNFELIFQMMDIVVILCIYIILYNVNFIEEIRGVFGNVVNSLQYVYIIYLIWM